MKFEYWIEEIEAISTRSEKIYKEVLYFKNNQDADNLEIILDWLKSAYEAGYEAGKNNK